MKTFEIGIDYIQDGKHILSYGLIKSLLEELTKLNKSNKKEI